MRLLGPLLSALVLAAPATAAAEEVRIRTTAGTVVAGELLDTLPDGYLIRRGDGRTVKIPFGEVTSVTRGAPPAAATGPRGADGIPRELWVLEQRQLATVEVEPGGPGIGIGVGFGTAVGSGTSVGGGVSAGTGGGRLVRSSSQTLLVVREGGLRDVPAREIIEKSGAKDLEARFRDVGDDLRGDRVWAHIGYGVLQAAGIAATIVGVTYLTKDAANDDEQTRNYAIGGIVTVIGASITLDTPFRWYRRGKQLDAQLDDLDRTPYVEAFMSADRARTEVDRHNRSLGLR